MVWTLIGISILVFIIIQLPPGDYLSTYMAEIQAMGEKVADEKIAFLREQYGLDKPLWQQYLVWVTGLLHGDLGYSFEYNQPVADVIGDRLFLTLVLNFFTVVFIYVVSFPIGVYSATHQYSAADHGLSLIRMSRAASSSRASSISRITASRSALRSSRSKWPVRGASTRSAPASYSAQISLP